MKAGTLVVGGAIAQKPHRGGHTWVFLQYLLGFRRLGWDVLFLDQLDPALCVDAAGAPCAAAQSVGARYLHDVMARIGADDRYALIAGVDRPFIGLPRREVEATTRDAALLLNVNGFIRDHAILAAARRRVFLDIDPGLGQMWRALGLRDVFSGHDSFATIGEHIGSGACPVPTCDIDWIATRPPVVLAEWPVRHDGAGSGFTSVATWRGAYGPVEYDGKTYGLRVHEFRKFAAIPVLSGRPFEVALDIHAADQRDATLLAANNWSLADPAKVARDPLAYRAYIQGSGAEFTIAKNRYVDSRCGWMSDRSVCYLASGKPVVMQDTGIGTLYPMGQGLLTFTTVAEALGAVDEVSTRYAEHSRAARRVAEEYFDSDLVLPRLLAGLRIA